MRFVAVDLETTGLNPNVHGVIEFGAVFADLEGRVKPQEFQRWIVPQNFVWDSYCLMLHAKLIAEIDGRVKEKDPLVCLNLQDVAIQFKEWLYKECEVPLKEKVTEISPYDKGLRLEKVTGAGKNFGSFDLQFLLKEHCFRNIFRHRSIDPTAFYIKPDDAVPPELKECKKRAGFEAIVVHRGLADAWDVVDLLQAKFQ